MSQWLHHDIAAIPDEEFRPQAPEALAVLSKLPEDAINYAIHNKFIPTAKAREWPTLNQWQTRRQQLLAQLRDEVFRWFPREKIPFKTTVRPFDGGWAARYADYQDFEFTSEPGVRLRAQFLRSKTDPQTAPVLIYAKRRGDSIYFLDLDELLPVLGRYSVLILNPRLTEGAVSPFEYAEIERTASWVGRTVASMQVWDILRSVEWLVSERKAPVSSISIYGKEDLGILAVYAGLFDQRISRVILNDPPASHWSGPALLNVLRVTDIPEVLGAFAPRSIVSLTRLPDSFGYARSIFKLNGQPARLSHAASLPEALRVWDYSQDR
jgi:hypothetical protein